MWTHLEEGEIHVHGRHTWTGQSQVRLDTSGEYGYIPEEARRHRSVYTRREFGIDPGLRQTELRLIKTLQVKKTQLGKQTSQYDSDTAEQYEHV